MMEKDSQAVPLKVKGLGLETVYDHSLGILLPSGFHRMPSVNGSIR